MDAWDKECSDQIARDIERQRLPVIYPANVVEGKTLKFRNVDLDDAAFIVELRLAKGQFLSPTDGDIAKQEEWIKEYHRRPGEAYFIIAKDNKPYGTVRLYNAIGNRFSWGSWILMDGAPQSAAIESACMVYRYGFQLGFRGAHFEVNRSNESVWKFHERFGAKRVKQSETEYFYVIDEGAIEASLQKYSRFLPG